MNYRSLGRTGMSVSEVGYGAWGIGGAMWKESDDAVSMRALNSAADAGINFFDTALAYGDGHSERLVGRVMKGRTDQLYVATKIPPKNFQWPARNGTPYREVFPAEYLVACTETSLRNLGRDQIDLQQLHVWLDDWVDVDEIWTAIDRLKREGKIRAFGISINDHDPASALKAALTGRVDAFQVIYNIFDQSPEEELFPLCQRADIGILARVPFDEGGLTGKIGPTTIFPPQDWRNSYFRGERKRLVHDRVEGLTKLLGEEASTLPELALRFCIAHPAVTTVIPGMRTTDHVRENASVADGRILSDSMREKLKKHRWVRNFYGD